MARRVRGKVVRLSQSAHSTPVTGGHERRTRAEDEELHPALSWVSARLHFAIDPGQKCSAEVSSASQPVHVTSEREERVPARDVI